jgi:glycine cleavage system aminomethyltransferase T
LRKFKQAFELEKSFKFLGKKKDEQKRERGRGERERGGLLAGWASSIMREGKVKNIYENVRRGEVGGVHIGSFGFFIDGIVFLYQYFFRYGMGTLTILLLRL